MFDSLVLQRSPRDMYLAFSFYASLTSVEAVGARIVYCFGVVEFAVLGRHNATRHSFFFRT